ncbi:MULTISPECIES: hypothetical protein [Lactobacillus]|uniref:Uncharacterized protein n=1 Tax=Lactobacillus xujianguonis TaxID=2495899 RepID=A0A437STD7_9LACO|nr:MULTISPECIES: hypothetical protein [Lactobacillus]RVU70178.1 hypothetical protein EJK17_09100 [Lactobacillus xujianguonis]RVU73517.1 hypothetical protein EJK20_07740 [Lactobacillus xujianguonis]
MENKNNPIYSPRELLVPIDRDMKVKCLMDGYLKRVWHPDRLVNNKFVDYDKDELAQWHTVKELRAAIGDKLLRDDLNLIFLDKMEDPLTAVSVPVVFFDKGGEDGEYGYRGIVRIVAGEGDQIKIDLGATLDGPCDSIIWKVKLH